MTRDAARQVAHAAIAHLAGDEKLILGLLQQAGLSPDTLRSRIDDPELLAGVLDFVLGDETVARDFCTAEGLSAEDLLRARHAFPGASSDYV